MFRGRCVALVAVLLIAASAVQTRAQSLADVARKEEERRKQVPAPAKTYTNKDLRPTPGSADAKAAEKGAADKDADAKDAAGKDAAAKDPAAKDAAAKGSGSKDAPDKDSAAKAPVKDQAYWSGRVKTVQEQLDRDQTYADALQSRINALTTDFVNRDDPAQRNVIERDRKRALAELDQLKKTIPIDKKAIDDLMEEARRAGVPPGWLR